MKRFLKHESILILLAILVMATLVYAGTVERKPYGVATHYWYDYTEATRTVGSYYLYPPTLTANDEVVGKDTTQTLTNKTLTSPAVNEGVDSGVSDYQGYLDNPKAVFLDQASLTYTAGTGYSIGESDTGVVFEIPISGTTEQAESDNCAVGPAGTGVTVTVDTPTAATHGRVIGIRNTSGTTPFIIRCGSGLPVGTTSGTTRQGGEDVGDITWVQQSYGTGISLYVVSEFKND